MLTLTFFVALIMLALAVGLTPLGGWVKPAMWLALSLLLSLLVALHAVVLRALVPLAVVGTLALSGCAWQPAVKTGLDSGGAALGGYRTLVELHYNDQCSKAAKACAPRGTAECPGYLECDGTRHKHYLAIKSGHALRAVGYTAVMIGVKKDALDALEKVGALIQKLAAQLAKEGVR